MTDLGTLGGTRSEGMGINDTGQITGWSYISGDSGQHAFLYSGGVMSDLNHLIHPSSGWVLQDARGINNLGQITGTGLFNGQTRAYLLTPLPTPPAPEPPVSPPPVPEPATWAMLILGFGAVGAAMRRPPRSFAAG